MENDSTLIYHLNGSSWKSIFLEWNGKDWKLKILIQGSVKSIEMDTHRDANSSSLKQVSTSSSLEVCYNYNWN